ncbi:hypothetical protein Leryth_001324 [Lithospermum erythrorhizon]|nr:hypothetical protein Leryth_001324 [Lithospermum erythrorhizon]
MQRKGHVLVVAYPLQGHAAPLLKLSRRIAEHGIQVTFAIAEQERERMLTAMPDFEEANQLIKLVSVPDGSKSGYDRKVGRNLAERAPLQQIKIHLLEDMPEMDPCEFTW